MNNLPMLKLLRRVRPIELAALIKWLCRISYRETQIGARTLWLDPGSNFGQILLSNGNYEPATEATIRSLLKPGDTFVDVGANEGYFSLVGGEAVGPAGRVIAVEPQARLWPVIIRNLVLNRLHNCTLAPYAVGVKAGKVDLILYPSINNGATSVVSEARKTFFRRQQAVVMPLASLLNEYGVTSVTVMKIDIEGFELNALQSLGAWLTDGRVKNLLVELHPRQLKELGQSVAQVAELLTRSGYQKVPDTGVELWQRVR